MSMPHERDTILPIPDSDRAQQPDFSVPIPASDHDAAVEHHDKAPHHHRRTARHQRSGQHENAHDHGKQAAEPAAAATTLPR